MLIKMSSLSDTRWHRNSRFLGAWFGQEETVKKTTCEHLKHLCLFGWPYVALDIALFDLHCFAMDCKTQCLYESIRFCNIFL